MSGTKTMCKWINNHTFLVISDFVDKRFLDNFAFGRLRTSSGIFGNDRVVCKNPRTPRIKISRLYLRKRCQVYLICAMEIQNIHVVVHIFSGFALFTESECITELNPSASCWPLTRCLLIYQQTGANQNTVHLKTGFIWKFSREWLLWTGYASGGSLRKKAQSPTVKY